MLVYRKGLFCALFCLMHINYTKSVGAIDRCADIIMFDFSHLADKQVKI